MKKKGMIALLGGCLIIVSCVFIFWFYFSNPTSFLNHEQLKKKINHLFPEASVRTIQGTFHLDKKHVFVPFQTNENHYSISCWEWKKRKWELIAINTIGEPFLWKINKKDPSTYHFIWNIRPNDQVSSIQFYFNKNRGYHVTDGIEKYDPKIQMMKEILIQEKPFGFMKIPKDWVSVMKAVQKVELEKRKFDNMFPHPVISFGWLPKDKTGKEAELNHIFNENGFGSYGDELENLLILSGEEIEFSSR